MGRLSLGGMRPVYILNDNIITSLGFTTAGNITSLEKEVIGIRTVNDPGLYPYPVPLSLVDTWELNARFDEVLAFHRKTTPATAYTRLEKLFLVSIFDALKKQPVLAADPKTLLVISTTKGNIDLLENRYKMIFSHKRLYLWE